MILPNALHQPIAGLLLFAMIVSGLAPVHSEDNIELFEAKTSLEASSKVVIKLQAEVAAQRSQASALTANLASANAQYSNAREQYEHLRGVIEGLGAGALNGSTNEIQARLLAALGDLHHVDEQKQKLLLSLVNLSEAVMLYSKTPKGTDDDAKDKLDTTLSAAYSIINEAQTTRGQANNPGDLRNALVVNVKPEGGIAVFNMGSRDGVRVGMPFQIFRGNKVIARAMVVDIRKDVCGAIVQELLGADNLVKTGDRGEVDPTRTF
jgi:hypothetical protein